MAENFGIGSLGLGNLPGVLDTMELVRKAWSNFGLPSNFTPTMDLEELDKRIADFKAVEQWLNLNLGMLRGTIQTLEIQRGTVAALNAFGQAVGTPGAPADAAAQAMAAFASMQQAATGSRPAPSTGAAAGTSTKAASPAEPAAAPGQDSPRQAEAPGEEPGQRPGRQPASRKGGPPGGKPAAPDLAAGLTKAAAAAVNPAAWWNLLQSQFNQVAQAAMSGSGLGQPASARGAGEPGTARAAARARAGSKKKAAAGKTPGRRRSRPAGG